MAQSLIEQLQLGAVDGSAPITDLLRKAKLAAVKLQAADFISWIDKEMGGYRHNDELPDYRVVHGQLKFLNPVHGWRPIVGMGALEQGIHQPAGELFQLTQTETGYVTITIPERFRQIVCAEIGMELDVRLHVSLTALSGVLEGNCSSPVAS